MARRPGTPYNGGVGPGHEGLFDRVLSYCGLSSLIGAGVLQRALADHGVEPGTAGPEHYRALLPLLRLRLRTYLTEEDAERRIRQLDRFLAGADPGPARDAPDGGVQPKLPDPTAMPKLMLPTLTGSVERVGAALGVTLVGNADAPAAAALGTFLAEVSAIAQRMAAERVVVSLADLYFMNTSCLKQVVSWLGVIAKLPPGRRHPVRFEGSASVPWQARSLASFQLAAGADVVSVQLA